MKEKIDSILDNIKERLSSPLVFAFLVAWIFINWKITIALLWYDPPQKDPGHYSLIQYISENSSWWMSIWKPLIMGCLYTFLSPLLKMFISAFQTWVNTISDDWNLSISRTGRIPIEKYLDMRTEAKMKTDELTQLIESESTIRKGIKELELKNFDLADKLHEAKHTITKQKNVFSSIFDPNALAGEWVLHRRKIMQDASETFHIYMEGGEYKIRPLNSQAMFHPIRIELFQFDQAKGEVCMVLFSAIGFLRYCKLSVSEDNKMKGFEYEGESTDETYVVEYVPKSR
jgi:hypothetical protein